VNPVICLWESRIFPARELQKSAHAFKTLVTIIDWISSYVVKPHPDLGRSGFVCPYVPPAMKLNSVWLAVVRTEAATTSDLCGIVEKYLKLYQSPETTTQEGHELKTLILIFPDIKEQEAPYLIRDVHNKMKPLIVEAGLMLGEFYEGNPSPGLHNPQFHPLTSPVPLLIYRRMVPNDLVFLTKPSDPPESRAQFVHAYPRCLRHRISAEQRAQAQVALDSAQLKMGAACE
jgi:hypothetical protein